jgi:Zn finger protein HypA/HybF involved in hydrogenase expression
VHETHILNEILEMVRQCLKDRKVKEVKRIRVNIGVTKMLTPEGLKETFKILPKEDIFNSTQLEVNIVPGNKLSVEEVEILEG